MARPKWDVICSPRSICEVWILIWDLQTSLTMRETCVKKASSTLFNLVRGWMSSCARVCSGRFLLWLCHINISLNILAQPRMLLKKLIWFLTKLFGTNKLEFLRTFLRGTQREYNSKLLKHRIVKRILVFKR